MCARHQDCTVPEWGRLVNGEQACRQNGRQSCYIRAAVKRPEPGFPPPPPLRARGQMAAEESDGAAAAHFHATPQQMHCLFIEKRNQGLPRLPL